MTSQDYRVRRRGLEHPRSAGVGEQNIVLHPELCRDLTRCARGAPAYTVYAYSTYLVAVLDKSMDSSDGSQKTRAGYIDR